MIYTGTFGISGETVKKRYVVIDDAIGWRTNAFSVEFWCRKHQRAHLQYPT